VLAARALKNFKPKNAVGLALQQLKLLSKLLLMKEYFLLLENDAREVMGHLSEAGTIKNEP
jgi:hypothetical protein